MGIKKFLTNVYETKKENKELKREIDEIYDILADVKNSLKNIKTCTWQNPYRFVSKKEQKNIDYRLRVVREQIERIEEILP